MSHANPASKFEKTQPSDTNGGLPLSKTSKPAKTVQLTGKWFATMKDD